MPQTETNPNASRPPRLSGEAFRSALAATLAAIIALPTLFGVVAALDHVPDIVTRTLFVWVIYSVIYIALTVRVYRGADHSRLQAIAPQRKDGGVLVRMMRSGNDGPGFSVWFSVVALAAAALLPRVQILGGVRDEDQVLLRVEIVLTVVGAWVILLLSYAVHYVRRLIENRDCLNFPGPGQPSWSDIVYFTASVQTTFGTTDVTVQSASLRRSVTGHQRIAFIFNTVIIAMLISALTANS